MQFCPEPGCGVLVPSGYCPAHGRLTRTHDVRAHRWYVSSRWLRLRADILRRDPFCRMCRVLGRRTLTTDVDHILPHHGDLVRFWDSTNLQGLCKPCHSQKTASGL